jgi:hypothetical protein
MSSTVFCMLGAAFFAIGWVLSLKRIENVAQRAKAKDPPAPDLGKRNAATPDTILNDKLRSAHNTGKLLSYAASYLRDRSHYLKHEMPAGTADHDMLLCIARICAAGAEYLTYPNARFRQRALVLQNEAAAARMREEKDRKDKDATS